MKLLKFIKKFYIKIVFFLSDDVKYNNVNLFIKDLLTKKVNLRICNVSTLKGRHFFSDFDFEKLKDFKLKPPYLPSISDLSAYLNESNPYEDMVSQDNYVGNGKKDKDDYIPPGYDRHWADEF